MKTLHDLMPSPEILTKVRAEYSPRNRATLKPAAAACIGHVGVWRAGWLIERDEPDSPPHPYEGQMAWLVPTDLEGRGFCWAPACDLIPLDGTLDPGSVLVG